MPRRPAPTLAVLALVAAALALPGPPAAAVPQPCDHVQFVAGGAIPEANPTGLSSPMTVLPTGPIGRIVVTINITHTFDGDLDVTLRRGTTVVDLTSDNGGAGDDFANTRFADGASTAIEDGTAPFTGRFRPEDPLSVFRGREASGTWTLKVVDDAGGDIGTLSNWGLDIHFADCNVDADRDLVSDRQDNCPTLSNPDQADADTDGIGDVCEDSDGDGVLDPADACDALAGSTASGCPLKARTLSLDYGNGKFKGRLRSTALPACHNARPVSVWRERSGADQPLGTDTTAGTGTWSLTRARKPGRYYAVSPRVVIPDQGECSKTTSPTLRLQ